MEGFLDDIGSVKGKKGIFTIILISLIVTIFEMFMFYFVIVPDTVDDFEVHIKKVGDYVATRINKQNDMIQKKSLVDDVVISQATKVVFNEMTQDILNTMTSREQILTNKINVYTIYTSVIMVLIMAVILYLLWESIKNDPTLINGPISSHTNKNSDMTDSILTSILSVGILISFQILFYFYSRRYKYPGDEGDDELVWIIVKSIYIDPSTPETEVKSEYASAYTH